MPSKFTLAPDGRKRGSKDERSLLAMPKLLKPTLIVYWQNWGNTRPKPYWAFPDGKEIQFETLPEARAYATSNGYPGIQTRVWR